MTLKRFRNFTVQYDDGNIHFLSNLYWQRAGELQQQIPNAVTM
ncbi:hypothetical protein AVEN_37954-1, partial [Araneus ventricosus]